LEGARGGAVIRSVPGRKPPILPGAHMDPEARSGDGRGRALDRWRPRIGDVAVEEGVSVWPFSALGGDQDNCSVSAEPR
jgi:hypothetical protein